LVAAAVVEAAAVVGARVTVTAAVVEAAAWAGAVVTVLSPQAARLNTPTKNANGSQDILSTRIGHGFLSVF